MPDTSIYSPSNFRKFLEILRRGGKFVANPRTLFLLTEDDRRKVYGALGEGREGAGQDKESVIADSNLPIGSLLAYLSSWDDCSEVVLRLPRAENVPPYPETPPEAPARQESTKKQGSGEPPTPQIDQVEPGSYGIRRRSPNWDPVADPLGYLRFDS